MKKILGILLAVMMLGVFSFAAAEEADAGAKFESDWAFPGALVMITYEEDGYKIRIDIENEETAGGTVWEYSCLYNAVTDSLVSVSSSKTEYTIDDQGQVVYGETAYEGFDDEGTYTSFTIDENGKLIWKDGHENLGAELNFDNIGNFEGLWKNEEAQVEAEFMWEGMDPDNYTYTVYITTGNPEGDSYTSYIMKGDYDPFTGKMVAHGTRTVFTKNAAGEFDSADDGEEFEAAFTVTENGTLIYGEENGIELQFDILGRSNG